MRVLRTALAAYLLAFAGLATAATLTVDTTDDNTTDDSDCTLREAILAANGAAANADCGAASAGLDTIAFSIPGGGPHTISPTSALPTITQPAFVDGTTQAGATCSSGITSPITPADLRIELDGSSAPDGANGLHITAGSSTVRGLVVNNWPGNGILLATGGDNTIQCNHVGTNVAGTASESNGTGTISSLPSPDDGRDLDGVMVYRSHSNLIGGTSPGQGNVASGNNKGDPDGNGGHGLHTYRSDRNTIQGNLVGTNATGTAAVPNGSHGIAIDEFSDFTLMGGTVTGARNILSGNGHDGTQIDDDSNDTLVFGNWVGIDASGTFGIPNMSDGIEIDDDAQRTIVGGPTPAHRNIISGNFNDGFEIDDRALFTRIENNYIGLDPTGTFAIPNLDKGLEIDDSAEDTLLLNNVISGNGNGIDDGGGGGPSLHDEGIQIDDSARRTTLWGNIIGLDPTGTYAIPNFDNGIEIDRGSQDTFIGGPLPEHRNIISGNGTHGISIQESSQRDLRVIIEGNYIGTGTDVDDVFPNAINGINVDEPENDSSVTIRNNVIANHDGGTGIVLIAGTLTTFSNCIFDNGLGMTSAISTFAPNNYWGAPDGPAPIGSGNGINNNVSLGAPPNFKTAIGEYCLNTVGQEIPTLSRWGMLFMALVLLCVGVLVMRRPGSARSS